MKRKDVFKFVLIIFWVFIIKTDVFCERVVCRSIFYKNRLQVSYSVENTDSEVMLLNLYSMLCD